ncbi:MAG: pyridoxamine 5'-phosphate oxidase family protein, partial [bacterium]|nr:pyridoxamine 5'-phosphate oxidase family protein [bacterium]
SMHYIEELEEKIHAMEIMLYHLEDNPDKVRARLLKKEVTYRKLGILRLDIEEITGKKGNE